MASILVVIAYLRHALALVSYPWDWAPDEGLYLDAARRALEGPAALYPPWPYGPLLPAVLAPVVHLPHPLGAARLLALAWTAASAIAVATLARRGTSWAWASAGLALFLVPFDLTFWHLLVRVDGPMIALWLWAAVALLPRELGPGRDSLPAGRIALGTSLLLAAVLAKPTAVVHGAPLVLGWFLVDRRSAWRLAGATSAAGLAVLGLLHVATGGGLVWVRRFWAMQPTVPGHSAELLARFTLHAWPVLALALGTGVAAWAARARPHRDPALLLLAGGLAVAPLLAKQGAAANYLVPLLAATVVAACRWGATFRAGAVAGAALALALAATRPFPLPTALDEATARTFYGFTQEVRRRSGGPFLATRPELVYFLAGQPVPIEGSGFHYVAAAGSPQTEDALRGLEEARYALVVWTWPLPDSPRWTSALHGSYERVGQCRLGYYYGAPFPSHLALRRDLAVPFEPPPGTRCEAAQPSSTNGARRP
jgi:hypothetical protein